jgi:hypothetical protein
MEIREAVEEQERKRVAALPIEDRIVEGKPARFIVGTDPKGQVRELGYIVRPDDSEYNHRCEEALRASMENQFTRMRTEGYDWGAP